MELFYRILSTAPLSDSTSQVIVEVKPRVKKAVRGKDGRIEAVEEVLA